MSIRVISPTSKMARRVLSCPASMPYNPRHDSSRVPEYHFTRRALLRGDGMHRCLDARPRSGRPIDEWRDSSQGCWRAREVFAHRETRKRAFRAFFLRCRPNWRTIRARRSTRQARILVPRDLRKRAWSPEGAGDPPRRTADEFRCSIHRAADPRDRGYSITAIPRGTPCRALALESGDDIFFKRAVPELSRTRSRLLDTPLAIVATTSERCRKPRKPRNARIVPWNSTAGAVNDVFMEIAPARARATRSADAVSAASYRASYAEALPARAKSASTALPDIDSRWLGQPDEALHPWTLAALFDDAIGCGRASSLEILRHQTRAADAELEAALARPAPAAWIPLPPVHRFRPGALLKR